jgi:hypothetical protein
MDLQLERRKNNQEKSENILIFFKKRLIKPLVGAPASFPGAPFLALPLFINKENITRIY